MSPASRQPTGDATGLTADVLVVGSGAGGAPTAAILAEAGFDGPVCVELASLGPTDVDELAMVERSIGWLREHVPGVAAA